MLMIARKVCASYSSFLYSDFWLTIYRECALFSIFILAPCRRFIKIWIEMGRIAFLHVLPAASAVRRTRLQFMRGSHERTSQDRRAGV